MVVVLHVSFNITIEGYNLDHIMPHLFDSKGLIPNYDHTHEQKYTNYGDPVSMFDRPHHSTLNKSFTEQTNFNSPEPKSITRT